MTTLLFRDDDLLVRATAAGAAREACVVTFDHLGSPADLDRPGFGEAFLAARGIDTVAVRGRGDHWYHYPGTAAALAAVARHVAGYRRVVTYGSSMGGYAAWRFAGAVGADACLALSPQFSIDPAIVPFEDRWAQAVSRIAWRRELEEPTPHPFTAVIVFDNRSIDRRHAALIAAAMPIVPIVLPFGGHPVATMLASTGLLEPLLMAVLRGDLDAPAFQREAQARRRGDPVRLLELARRLPPRRRPLAIRLARLALERMPESDFARHVLATLLAAAGEHGEALPLHALAYATNPAFPAFAQRYSEALYATGDLPAALAIARAAAAEHPGEASLHSWLGQLWWADGDRAAAFACAERAVALSPLDPAYAETLALYHYRETWPVRGRRAVARLLRWIGPRR